MQTYRSTNMCTCRETSVYIHTDKHAYLPCSTVQYSTVQFVTSRHVTVQYNTVQYSTAEYSTLHQLVFSHSFINIPPWFVSQGGYVRRDAGASAVYGALSVCLCVLLHVVLLRASESLGGGRPMPNPAAVYTVCTQGTLCANRRRKQCGRWKRKTARLYTTLNVSVCTVLCVVHVSRTLAVLRCALRRFTLSIHSFNSYTCRHSAQCHRDAR